jgi:hypothetical protein
MQGNGVLSNYETLRLENIRRNQEFLSTLGLSATKPPSLERISSEIVEVKRKRRRQTNESSNEHSHDPIIKRRSSRISLLPVKEEVVTTTVKTEVDQDSTTVSVINYEFMPQQPESLDDFEFECFTILKKWRLNLCHSLGIDEPYKVMKNRTLCELIRRRRNDAKYATESSKVESDLLSCWGIGPAKASAAISDAGFGFQLISFINEGESCESIAKLLEKSRSLHIHST